MMTRRITTHTGAKAAVSFMEAYLGLVDEYNAAPNRAVRNKILLNLRETFIEMAAHTRNTKDLSERLERHDEN